MSTTTFTRQHIIPAGRAMLSCSCLVPDGWVALPLPEETQDFDNPTVFLPLLVCMAPYGAVVFTIAARPAFDDGSVQDWAEYLAAHNNMQVERIQEARVNRLPCILMDATMPSDAGVMRSRSVFLEDGRRLFNIGTLAPDAIWSSVQSDFDRLLGAFTLDEVHGITAVPLRLMTSDPSLDLSGAVATTESPADAPSPPNKSTSKPAWVYAEDDPDPIQPPDPPRPDPEFAGQPDWWREAVLLERADRLEEAEETIQKAVDHIGAYSSIANLYEKRCARLEDAGRHEEAAAARERAIHWLYVYASSATSGGEGAALSRERDQRLSALGAQVPRR